VGDLTDDQGALLHQALRELERELAGVEHASAESTSPVDLEEPIGRISRIDAIQQQRMASANRASIQRRLQQVRAALRRFDQGEYGTCVGCGEDVGYPRLEARPEAPFCIACQGTRERRDKR